MGDEGIARRAAGSRTSRGGGGGVKRATGGDAHARGRGVARGGACGGSHLHSATALKLGGGLSAQAPAAMPSKASLPTLTFEAEAGKTMRSSK